MPIRLIAVRTTILLAFRVYGMNMSTGFESNWDYGIAALHVILRR